MGEAITVFLDYYNITSFMLLLIKSKAILIGKELSREMMLTVEIPAEVEAGLAREALARGVAVSALAARLLEEAVATAIRHDHTARRSPGEIRAWLDSLAEFSEQIPPLADETFSRATIYQDHD
jgi:hypothetical protein